MTKDEFITKRTRIISEMLDNPDKYGIYPTTKCFNALDELYDKIKLSNEAKLKEELIRYDKYIYNHIHTGETSEVFVNEYLKQRKDDKR